MTKKKMALNSGRGRSPKSRGKTTLKLEQELARASRLTAMGAMASTLAHELNQPLTAAANYLVGTKRMLESGESPSTELIHTGLSESEAQIRRAGEIIRRVRHMVSDDPVPKAAVSLKVLVEDAIKLIKAGGEHTRVQFSEDLSAEVDTLQADPIQLEQVLVNLIRNACQAMSAMEQPRLIISTRGSNGYAEVRVSDTGPGISSDTQRIFDALGHSSSGGMGVGLSISRTIVEAHGGRIWAENNPTQGASFCFTVPVAP